MTRAVCSGSFDPVTLGHMDIFERGSRMFDELLVCVFRNEGKQGFFPVEKRVALLTQATTHLPNVRVMSFAGLITDFMQQQQASIILRGIRSVKDLEYDVIVGPESRGFIFGVPIAVEEHKGFVPVRKPGKLPRETISCKYDLEYGSNELFMHKDAIKPGQRVVIIDDLLATGGTCQATIKMIEQLGGVVAGIAFIIELDGLNGRKNLEGYNVKALLNMSDK